LLRRRRIAALALAVPLAGALGAALFLPRSYRATAVAVVERGAGIDDDAVDARISVLLSENLRRSRLADLIARFQPFGPSVGRNGSREAAIDQLQKQIVVEQEKEDRGGRSVTSAISVTVTARSPQLAADLANELAAFYEREDLRMREERAARTTSKLEEQLADAKQRLDQQAARVMDYKMRNLHELPEQVGLHLAELAQLNAQMRVGRDGGAPRSGSVVRAPTQTPQFDPRLDRLAALRTRYTDAHPEVKQLKREIELNPMRPRPSEAAGEAERDPETEAAAATARMESARRRIAELAEKATKHEQGILNAPFRQQELDALLPDYLAARSQYQTLWEKYELAKAWDPQHDGGRISVLDAAVPRDKAVSPSFPKIMAIGLALALALAAGAVLLAERMDSSFHTVEDLRVFTRVPVLASVPRLPTAREHRRKARESRLLAAKFLAVLVLTFAGSAYVSRTTPTLVAWIHQARP
jgi:uncharacterized protein involved in exopolysaccharide biosynthesis